ncbi:MAG TPA: DoxX family protein [Burkholderiales bacterium]|nr:DoxX family protein [Burkholderiales bacterium]
MDLSFITQGAQAPNVALTLNRMALGAFFAISGYHKLFNASRRAGLRQTLQDDGVHIIPVMRWVLPGAELAGGCALLAGLLAVPAAFGLFVICVGAIALDAIKRIRAWRPIDRADWLGDLLYLPESLYCIGLAVVMLAGPGRWSLDAAIAARLAGTEPPSAMHEPDGVRRLGDGDAGGAPLASERTRGEDRTWDNLTWSLP